MAVLAWMLAQHPQLEIQIGLRTAARKLGLRAEFRDVERLGWFRPGNNRPEWLKGPTSGHPPDPRPPGSRWSITIG